MVQTSSFLGRPLEVSFLSPSCSWGNEGFGRIDEALNSARIKQQLLNEQTRCVLKCFQRRESPPFAIGSGLVWLVRRVLPQKRIAAHRLA